ncbi:hypothetical protein FQA39_LY05193 [Lamprigera yunnana]|nr:hypothetical protein FQA39_LY05193 [Lamprigera yunnana]
MEKEDNFWKLMINKLEQRNCKLSERQSLLRQRIASYENQLDQSENEESSCSSDETSSSSCGVTSASTCSCKTDTSVSSNSKSTSCISIIKPPCVSKQKSETSNFDTRPKSSKYMNQLCELINKEKQLKRHIKEMELREQKVSKRFNEQKQTKTTTKSSCNQTQDDARFKYEKMTQKLLEENSNLCDLLQQSKQELKHCLEALKGPISRQIEQEKCRAAQLERDLEKAVSEMADKHKGYEVDMCELKSKLCETTDNLEAMTELNQSLQQQMCSMSRKYKNLAEKKINKTPVEEKQPKIKLYDNETNKKSDKPDNLHNIARKLSTILMAMCSCDMCERCIQPDLKETIVGIKKIADLVEKQRKKSEQSKIQSPDKPNSSPPPQSPSKHDDLDCTKPTFPKSARPKSKSGKRSSSKRCRSSCGDEPVDKRDLIMKEVQGKTVTLNDAKILTEVKTTEDVEIFVETSVELYDEINEEVSVTTSVLDPDTLEIITVGPASVLETTMTRTHSGKVEIATEIVDCDNDLKEDELKLFPVPESTTPPLVTDIPPAEPNVRKLNPSKELEDSTKIRVGEFHKKLDEIVHKTNKEVIDMLQNVSNVIQKANQDAVLDIQKVTMMKSRSLCSLNNAFNKQALSKLLLPGKTAPTPITITRLKDAISLIAGRGDSSPSIDVKGILHKLMAMDNYGKLSTQIEEHGRFPIVMAARIDSEKSGAGSKRLNGIQHLPDCDCVECLCKPCISARSDKHPPNCDCIDCLCKEPPCLHEEKEIVKEEPAKKASTKKCNCVNCLCKPGISARSDKHPPNCDCTNCLCKEPPCSHEEKEIVKKKPAKEASTKKCNCVDCLCKPCTHLRPDKHPPNCDCIDCLCKEPPCFQQQKEIVKEEPAKEASTKKCNCVNCLCKPCISERSDKHPPNCDCTDCLCKEPPCFHEEKEIVKEEPAKEASSKKCDCVDCLCKPCTDLRPDKHPPNCDCLDCLCKEPPCFQQQKEIVKKVRAAPAKKARNKKCKSATIKHYATPIHKKPCLTSAKLEKSAKSSKPCELNKQTLRGTSHPPIKPGTKSVREKATDTEKRSSDSSCVVPSYKDFSCNTPTTAPKRKVIKEKKEVETNACDCADCGIECTSSKCKQVLSIKAKYQKIIDEKRKCNKEKGIKSRQNCLDNIKNAYAETQTTVAKPRQNPLASVKAVIESIRDKCLEKDEEICAKINELKGQANSNIFCNMLGLSFGGDTMGSIEDIICTCEDGSDMIDSTRPNSLTSSNLVEKCSDIQVTFGGSLKQNDSNCSCASDDVKFSSSSERVHSQFSITELRLISADALLIKWSSPLSDQIIGYEVVTDGKIKSKVRSVQRKCAVIYDVTTTKRIDVSVFAVDASGRCHPPAHAVLDCT